VAQEYRLWALSDDRILACNAERVSPDLVKVNVPSAEANESWSISALGVFSAKARNGFVSSVQARSSNAP